MKLYRMKHGEKTPFCTKYAVCRHSGWTDCTTCKDRVSEPKFDHVFGPDALEYIGKNRLFHYEYDSAAGGEEDYRLAYAIKESGEVELLDYADSFVSPAQDVQSYEEEPESVPSIAEQVATLGDVVGVIIIASEDCSWQDYEDWEMVFEDEDGNPCLPDIGNGMGYTVYVPVRPIDWVKVRRRLEDAIRKDERLMRRLASQAGIRIW